MADTDDLRTRAQEALARAERHLAALGSDCICAMCKRAREDLELRRDLARAVLEQADEIERLRNKWHHVTAERWGERLEAAGLLGRDADERAREVPGLRAEVARLRAEVSTLKETARQHIETGEALHREREALRAAIEGAPHGPGCSARKGWPLTYVCTRCLTPILDCVVVGDGDGSGARYRHERCEYLPRPSGHREHFCDRCGYQGGQHADDCATRIQPPCDCWKGRALAGAHREENC